MAIKCYRALCDVYLRTSVKGEKLYYSAGDTVKFDDTNVDDRKIIKEGVTYKTIMSNTDYARSFKDAHKALAKQKADKEKSENDTVGDD